MNKSTLPTEDLKRFGIMNNDGSFNKKLKETDLEKFLNGYVMIAENKDKRLIFQLKENNTKLEYSAFQFEKSLEDIMEKSRQEIQYAKSEKLTDVNVGDVFIFKDVPEEKNIVTEILNDKNENIIGVKYKRENGNEEIIMKSYLDENCKNQSNSHSIHAFVYDKKNNEIKEYDILQHKELLKEEIIKSKDQKELNKYKNELLKLKGFLQDKYEKYPEIGKQIEENINIISNEISSIDGLSVDSDIQWKQEKSDIELDVNDQDLYQDANRMKEKQEQEQEQERKRGFRRY
ncbi:hypothetical protein [Riemerella columbipharyngis]|uniref:Uncharacterized protein n=1 Tax=Riemerella columbipharyngis TaxID=1071918 RepID=A0A1G6ZEL9_9FLAO|nr:hypothetical protein [Riemerella columbipharyngis]SDE00216.1 hypothetical protein SAMN05421544_10236 [Riemerella columbipharyngis]